VAGQTPTDVKALGIDCAGCGAYKWLMGDFGFRYLYVREDLQDTLFKRSRYGVRNFRIPTAPRTIRSIPFGPARPTTNRAACRISGWHARTRRCSTSTSSDWKTYALT